MFITSVLNITYDVKKLNRKFDYVLFMGVFYHLRHPLFAIEELRKITKGKLILQTITSKVENDIKKYADYKDCPPSYENIILRDEVIYKPEFPKMYFLENGIDGDDSNKWLPNIECITAMLRYGDFKIDKVEIQDREVYVLCS